MDFGGPGGLLCKLEAMKAFPGQSCASPVLTWWPFRDCKGDKEWRQGEPTRGATAGPAASSCDCV